MTDDAGTFRTIGLVMMAAGLLNLGVGIFGPRLFPQAKLPPGTPATMQWIGIGFILNGAVGYFQPWGEIVLHVVSTAIGAFLLAIMVIQFRRILNAARGNPPQ